MEVRIETGAGKEPEATISVLPSSAFPDMRRRVFAGRTSPDTVASEAVAAPADDPGRTLLRLPLRELLLCGFIENRGLVIIGAVYGLLWESGILGAIWTSVFGSGAYSRGLVRGMIRSAVSGGGIPIAQIALAVVGVAGLLLTVRIVSMGWAVVRLHGFQLTRAGEDLRTEFGLFTHVAATIPLQRVQTMTVREGPLHRLLGRVSVRVETAGGTGTPGQQATEREWLAPIVRRRDLPALAQQVVPGLDLDALTWQPPHPRAFRRAVKPALFLALLMTTLLCTVVHWRMIAVLPFALVWAVVGTRQYLKHYGWAATDEAVALRSGWLRRSVTIARVAKIQAVTRLESPFDRRTDMARVRADTAGAGERSHRIDVLYLPREAAVDLHRRLAAGAAGTAFRW
jgi:putative membrane protein